MATSRLEIEGVNKRNEDLGHSFYQQNINEYNELHPNTISDGDKRGKGDPYSTGVGNVDKSKGQIIDRSTISVYDNSDCTGIGNATDIATRRNLMEQLGDYNRNNEYSEEHKDALSDGDMKGKGTNSQLPDFVQPGGINRGYFQSVDTDNGGNNLDVNARSQHIIRNVYQPGINEYGENSVTISAVPGYTDINTYYLQ